MSTFLRQGARIIGLVFATIALHASDTAYLFTYFTHNGEDGLHLAWSEDGLNWQALNGGRSCLAPQIGTKEKLMRDPCVAHGPDGTVIAVSRVLVDRLLQQNSAHAPGNR